MKQYSSIAASETFTWMLHTRIHTTNTQKKTLIHHHHHHVCVWSTETRTIWTLSMSSLRSSFPYSHNIHVYTQIISVYWVCARASIIVVVVVVVFMFVVVVLFFFSSFVFFQVTVNPFDCVTLFSHLYFFPISVQHSFALIRSLSLTHSL